MFCIGKDISVLCFAILGFSDVNRYVNFGISISPPALPNYLLVIPGCTLVRTLTLKPNFDTLIAVPPIALTLCNKLQIPTVMLRGGGERDFATDGTGPEMSLACQLEC